MLQEVSQPANLEVVDSSGKYQDDQQMVNLNTVLPNATAVFKTKGRQVKQHNYETRKATNKVAPVKTTNFNDSENLVLMHETHSENQVIIEQEISIEDIEAAIKGEEPLDSKGDSASFAGS